MAAALRADKSGDVGEMLAEFSEPYGTYAALNRIAKDEESAWDYLAAIPLLGLPARALKGIKTLHGSRKKFEVPEVGNLGANDLMEGPGVYTSTQADMPAMFMPHYGTKTEEAKDLPSYIYEAMIPEDTVKQYAQLGLGNEAQSPEVMEALTRMYKGSDPMQEYADDLRKLAAESKDLPKDEVAVRAEVMRQKLLSSGLRGNRSELYEEALGEDILDLRDWVDEDMFDSPAARARLDEAQSRGLRTREDAETFVTFNPDDVKFTDRHEVRMPFNPDDPSSIDWMDWGGRPIEFKELLKHYGTGQ